MTPNHYFIALLPPEDIRNEILQLQQKVASDFKSTKSLNAPPHITLQMPFRRDEEEMKRIVATLNDVAGKFSPFRIDLDGFGHFERKTIYIRVQPSDHLSALQKELTGMLRDQAGFASGELTQIFTPHISVARRDLHKRIFPEAWNYFEAHRFSRNFMADAFSLLLHNENRWHITETFQFTGKR